MSGPMTLSHVILSDLCSMHRCREYTIYCLKQVVFIYKMLSLAIKQQKMVSQPLVRNDVLIFWSFTSTTELRSAVETEIGQKRKQVRKKSDVPMYQKKASFV